MERGIPGLKKAYSHHLGLLRTNRTPDDEARRQLNFWSARYVELVTDGDTMYPGTDVYTNILDAYARREALKQYLEEMK